MLRTLVRVGIFGAVALALLVGIVRWRHRATHPYGWSHCCDKGLYMSLRAYAEEHDGHFPAGESSPEASLSLLYRGGHGVGADLLRGKTVPEAAVQEVLDRGELLGPNTCGWHYVEGLTLADDSNLALFWDKVGLGHNGRVLPRGGHEVCLLGGGHEYIPEADWPQFLQKQEALLVARGEAAIKGTPILSARVRLPSGEIVDRYDASFSVSYAKDYDSGSRSGSGRGSSQGPQLSPQVLRWWKLAEFGLGGAKEGSLTLTLSLGDWKSEPVTLTLSDGGLSSSTIVFEMEEQR